MVFGRIVSGRRARRTRREGDPQRGWASSSSLICSRYVGSQRSSASRKLTSDPRDASIPMFLAAVGPGFPSCDERDRGTLHRARAVRGASVEPSSTTTTSKSEGLCSNGSSVAEIVRSALNAGTTTEKRRRVGRSSRQRSQATGRLVDTRAGPARPGGARLVRCDRRRPPLPLSHTDVSLSNCARHHGRDTHVSTCVHATARLPQPARADLARFRVDRRRRRLRRRNGRPRAGWVAGAPFPISYVYQENSGKHVAENVAAARARGELMTTLDSDDWYVPHALSTFIELWASIPSSQRESFVGGAALCSLADGSLVGTPFPSDPLDTTYGELRTAMASRATRRLRSGRRRSPVPSPRVRWRAPRRGRDPVLAGSVGIIDSLRQ